jgi:hypothetical protein
MKSSNHKNTSVKVGNIYECKTFAGIVVHQKIVGYYKRDIENGHHYKAVRVRKSDIVALKKAGVSYKGDEVPEECEGVVFEFQIVKKVRNVKKKKNLELSRDSNNNSKSNNSRIRSKDKKS